MKSNEFINEMAEKVAAEPMQFEMDKKTIYGVTVQKATQKDLILRLMPRRSTNQTGYK
jgi:hypothetical protein